MYKEVLTSIKGIEIGGIFSFLIFFIFFVVMIIYLTRMKKEYRDTMKNLPLD